MRYLLVSQPAVIIHGPTHLAKCEETFSTHHNTMSIDKKVNYSMSWSSWMSSSTLSYQSNSFFFHAITNQSHAVEGELCRVEFIHELLSSESSAKKRKKIPQLTYFLTRSNTLTKLVLTTQRQTWWQKTPIYASCIHKLGIGKHCI